MDKRKSLALAEIQNPVVQLVAIPTDLSQLSLQV
jgi:hypothetical protein